MIRFTICEKEGQILSINAEAKALSRHVGHKTGSFCFWRPERLVPDISLSIWWGLKWGQYEGMA